MITRSNKKGNLIAQLDKNDMKVDKNDVITH